MEALNGTRNMLDAEAIDRAATPADLRLTAGQTEYFGIAPGAVLQVLKA